MPRTTSTSTRYSRRLLALTRQQVCAAAAATRSCRAPCGRRATLHAVSRALGCRAIRPSAMLRAVGYSLPAVHCSVRRSLPTNVGKLARTVAQPQRSISCSPPPPPPHPRPWEETRHYASQVDPSCGARDRARRRHIRAGTGLAAATSVPGPGSPLPHLRRECARRCHICTGTALTGRMCSHGSMCTQTLFSCRATRCRSSRASLRSGGRPPGRARASARPDRQTSPEAALRVCRTQQRTHDRSSRTSVGECFRSTLLRSCRRD
jgi:hypothetical protein